MGEGASQRAGEGLFGAPGLAERPAKPKSTGITTQAQARDRQRLARAPHSFFRRAALSRAARHGCEWSCSFTPACRRQQAARGGAPYASGVGQPAASWRQSHRQFITTNNTAAVHVIGSPYTSAWASRTERTKTGAKAATLSRDLSHVQPDQTNDPRVWSIRPGAVARASTPPRNRGRSGFDSV